MDDAAMEQVLAEATTVVLLRRRHVRAVLEEAFVGGSLYWADRIEAVTPERGATWSDEVVRGGTIRVIPRDDPEYAREINIAAVVRGLQQALWAGFVRDVDYIDAGEADSVLQLAMWGEVIYG